MGAWDDAVANSGAHGRLQETDVRLQQVRDRIGDGGDLDGWDRLNRLAEETKAKLDLSDRSLLSSRMLDELDDALIELNRVLDAALADPDQLDLSATGAPAEGLANALAGWPPLAPAEQTDAQRAAVNGLRDATQAAIAALEERLREVSEQADALKEGIATAETANSAALEGLRAEVVILTNTIDQEKLRLDQANQANQALFEQTQAQRSTEHQTAETQRATEFRDLIEKAKETFETTTSEIGEKSRAHSEAASQAAKEHVEALEKLREQARDLVGVIGRTGMTGGYQQDAVKEEQAANFWRWVTVGFAVAAIVVLSIAVYVATYVSTDATRLAAKVLLSAAFGGVATYTARQSAHHRAIARNARNLELALASIGPYLEPLDEEKKKEVLEVFAYILFAQRPVSPDSNEAIEMGPTNVQTLIEAITKVRGP